MARVPHSPKQSLVDFQRSRPFYSVQLPDIESVDHLREIANTWSNSGRHFYAGYTLCQTYYYSWGEPELMASCGQAAFQEFQHAVEDSGVTDLERVASLWMWSVEIGMYDWLFAQGALRSAHRALQTELAQSLIRLAENTSEQVAREGYLVRGFKLVTDFDDAWLTEFPKVEIKGNAMSAPGAGSLLLTVQSAFQLSLNIGDYVAADNLAAQCPEAFTTHGLQGWRAAVTGLLNDSKAVECFSNAAIEFSQDVPNDERMAAGLSWTSANLDLWSKYFGARSAVAAIVQTPSKADELVLHAEEILDGTEGGWTSPQVTCFRIVVGILNRIIRSTAADVAAARAKAAFNESRRHFGWDENEQLVVEFLDNVERAFTELRHEPAMVVLSTGVRDALESLGRIPLVGVEVASAIGPAVAQRTFANLLGQDQTWIYRTIEAIEDERVLQRLILRLMQARHPLYAQIRHGPAEYGKDIVVLVEENDEYVLQMYQVKAGDISIPVWRTARAELEEMFLMDVPPVTASR